MNKFFLYQYIFIERDIYKYTGKTIYKIMRIRVHSAFYMQNLMLAAYRPNLAEVARTV